MDTDEADPKLAPQSEPNKDTMPQTPKKRGTTVQKHPTPRKVLYVYPPFTAASKLPWGRPFHLYFGEQIPPDAEPPYTPSPNRSRRNKRRRVQNQESTGTEGKGEFAKGD
ncbi:hypothetical protein NMY22_g9302 [Coprinellus aureogranulatus]|nr:hypothetical protein NMY22_g9302 [Coprinellus aureogranulatus]